MTLRSIAQAVAAKTSPPAHKIGLHKVMQAVETYCAFLSGRGSGSGWDGENETATVAAEIKRRPAVIFDVGANNGAWSASLSRQLKSEDSRFFLFECAPYCFEGIEKRSSQIPNLKLIKCAVSDRAGSVKLHLPPEGSGLASLHERRDVSVKQYIYEDIEVESRTLDEIALTEEIERIDLLKMDIEGHELFALRGASKLLDRDAIDVISFEFGSGNVNSRTFFRDFWEELTPRGFKIARLIPGGGTTTINTYSEHLEYFRGATNYLAILGR